MTVSMSKGEVGNARLGGAVLAAVLLAAVAFYSTIQLHHDVAWYVYCNLRQLEGMRPYIDIIEVSPPIAFYLTLLPVAVASWTGLAVKFCIAFYVVALTAFSLWLSIGIDQRLDLRQRCWKMAMAAALLLVIPIGVFAQREHFAVLLGLPYFYVCTARLADQKVSWRIALLAGLMAGIGLSIKHYFLLAPLLVELHLMLRRRNILSPLRPEILGAILSGLAYAAFVFVKHPEYLSVSVPLILAAYESYSRPIWLVILNPWAIVTLFGSLLWLRARYLMRWVQSVDILFVAALAFYICMLWQAKGWAYHSLPSNMMLVLAALEAATLAKIGQANGAQWPPTRQHILFAAPIVLVVLQTFIGGHYRSQFALDAEPYVEKYAPNGGSVYFMSSNLSSGFPLVTDSGATWASRFATQWLLPDVIRGYARGSELPAERRKQLEWVEKLAVDTTVEDFQKFVPKIVFVDRAYDLRRTALYGGIPFNMVNYFNQDPRFARIWASYRKVATLDTYLSDLDRFVDVWVLSPPP